LDNSDHIGNNFNDSDGSDSDSCIFVPQANHINNAVNQKPNVYYKNQNKRYYSKSNKNTNWSENKYHKNNDYHNNNQTDNLEFDF